MQLQIITLDEDKSKEIYSSGDCQMILNTYDEYYNEIGYHRPWVGYFVLHNDRIVGSCGFTGQPNDGKVEIAYWTFKEYEGRGVASFACKELVSISRKHNTDIIVTAKTAPEHNASTKILLKNGFEFTGIVQDHEIGDAWIWTLMK